MASRHPGAQSEDMVMRGSVTRSTFILGAAGALVAAALPARAEPKVGAPAPGLVLTDSNGRTIDLGSYRGKTVVLEWTNHDCPFVRKHYGGNNMQSLQKKWTAQGVVWLTLISSMPGSQGYVTADEANRLTADRHAAPSAVLFDPKGSVGRSYGAQTTPHMYVITGDGNLVYMGGIDDKATTRLEDLKTAKNFVDQALSEVTQGKPVSTTTARPYGCSIKYSS
jgi:peroxiredoxin